MHLDNETQKKNLLEIIDATAVNGQYAKVLKVVIALGQLRQEIQLAKVGPCNGGCSTEGADPAARCGCP